MIGAPLPYFEKDLNGNIKPGGYNYSEATAFTVKTLADLQKYKTNLKTRSHKPPLAIAFRNGLEEYPVFYMGSLGVISGRQKSRKSMFVSMLTAAALSGSEICETVRSYMPADKKNVLFFDTEMEPYYAEMAARRAADLAELDDESHFHHYQFCELNTKERLEGIETALREHNNYGFVVIDGVADLVDSVNDEAACKKVVDDLKKWASQYNCAIICVIHENKGSSTIRGHLGTILQIKAATVITVEKLDEENPVSAVKPRDTRDKPFKAFGIYLDEETNLPAVDHDTEIDTKNKSFKQGGRKESKLTLEEFSHGDHKNHLSTIFSNAMVKEMDPQSLKDCIYATYPDIKKKEAEAAPAKLVAMGFLKGNGRKTNGLMYSLSEQIKQEISPF